MAFIDGFRGSMRALDLLRLLERAQRWRDKEERRGDGGDDEATS